MVRWVGGSVARWMMGGTARYDQFSIESNVEAAEGYTPKHGDGDVYTTRPQHGHTARQHGQQRARATFMMRTPRGGGGGGKGEVINK